MISEDFRSMLLDIAAECYTSPYEDVVLIALEEHFNAIVTPSIGRYGAYELETISIIVKDNEKDEVQEIVNEYMPPWCTVNVYSDNREYLANLEQRIQQYRSKLKGH